MRHHCFPAWCRFPCCRQDRSFNLQFLKEEFDIGAEQIEALYQFAKFQFDCGNYSMASELLQVRIVSTAVADSNSSNEAMAEQLVAQCAAGGP